MPGKDNERNLKRSFVGIAAPFFLVRGFFIDFQCFMYYLNKSLKYY